ncbi:hypothetical protein P154DRAFT_213404 [Amniculicola lignicola CBS 123094]|uniref:Uncharacterized protein n=1 Tax=Amniculicola lignicola CBS 123094 TaxID=1392246 RepID=A0A6A5WDP0_9PLEO|nr:hypothetical protein P154DRAFT_213404 [Amniculicola lignicola CBS 123094]
MVKVFRWNIPVNQQKCAALGFDVACPYGQYSDYHAVLQQDQKLTAANDITGVPIVKAFIASTSMALILSILLIMDKIKYHFFHRSKKRSAKLERPFYLRLIHTIESLLQTLSDQQLVTGISMLACINLEACKISAYHYNLVCTMLMLSAITHLNTLINISDFIYKGKSVAFQRVLGIALQIILTGMVLSARNTSTFPTRAGPQGILPAACFENMNATTLLGLSDFKDLTNKVTANNADADQIFENLKKATSAQSGLTECITLIIFVAFALAFLVLEYCEAKFWPQRYFHFVSITLSATSVIASVAITVLAMSRYTALREAMEVDKWYDEASGKGWSYSQIIPAILLASGSITLVKAITGIYRGPESSPLHTNRGHCHEHGQCCRREISADRGGCYSCARKS